jgi:alpha-tubulin suppressor-like RCC1 family protein
MPVLYSGVQYSGIWTLQQAHDAIAAGTWPQAPAPYLFSWGSNSVGQLGQNSTTNFSSPKQVGSLTTWSKLSAGSTTSMAIKTDGTLWSWGNNNSGQLGLGDTVNRSSPVQIGSLTEWAQISSGGSPNTLAIKNNGTLWSWGNNLYGQLGLSNQTYYSSPKQVGALTNWLQVSAGHEYTLAVKTDNTLWGWGYTFNGTIGNGSSGFGNIQSPVQVGAAISWSKTSAGYNVSHGISTSGALYAWGANGGGQLGLGNTTDQSLPQQVGSLTDWLDVAGYYGWSMAIKTDGTMWAWGVNSFGRLGLGNTTNYSSPKQVGALTSWVKLFVAKGVNTCLAIKNDGTLWSWGSSNSGQLGLGNTTDYSSPKQVGSSTNWLTASIGNQSIGINTTTSNL